MAFVLVRNERTATEVYDHWKDVTGEQYHFPNQYKNRVEAGTPFVYYRGTRRVGGRRGATNARYARIILDKGEPMHEAGSPGVSIFDIRPHNGRRAGPVE